jgi:hypothetical protein
MSWRQALLPVHRGHRERAPSPLPPPASCSLAATAPRDAALRLLQPLRDVRHKTRHRRVSCVALPPASARLLCADCEMRYRRQWLLSKPRRARRRWPPRTRAMRCALWFFDCGLAVADSLHVQHAFKGVSFKANTLPLAVFVAACRFGGVKTKLGRFCTLRKLHARTTTLCAMLAVAS